MVLFHTGFTRGEFDGCFAFEDSSATLGDKDPSLGITGHKRLNGKNQKPLFP